MKTLPSGTSGKQLECRTEATAEAMILRLSGEVDLATAPLLFTTLKTFVEDGYNAIVDLSGLRYIDSTGFRVLFDANRLFLERTQRLVLTEPSAAVRKIMDIIGVEKNIPVFPSIEAARESIPASTVPEKSGNVRVK